MAATLTTAITAAIMNLITGLEGIAGYPIVVLDRAGDDPSIFWHNAALKLCQRTNENWCDEDLVSLTDTTSALGWTRVITYVGRTSGQTKKVCLVLPPPTDVSPWMASQGLSSGAWPDLYNLPTSADTYTWLTLQAAANCIQDTDSAFADRRADAFATIATTLIDGDPVATQPNGIGPARLFQNFRNHDAIRWANDMAERYEFDIWKNQVAQAAPSTIGCQMTILSSANLATDTIARDPAILPADGCVNFGGGSSQTARVTDANLYSWIYSSPIGGQLNWQPYQGFTDFNASAQWTWTTASDLAKQYAQ
jgi:hypothetical protein